MTGNDYLRIWYRVQIGATLVILAMMMIRNYEFNRQTVALDRSIFPDSKIFA